MSLDISNLTKQMCSVGSDSFKDAWPEIKVYAEKEFEKISENIKSIGQLVIDGKITEEEARLQLNIQKKASKSVLCALEGISLLAAEVAINKALEVVKDAVNSVLKFTLI